MFNLKNAFIICATTVILSPSLHAEATKTVTTSKEIKTEVKTENKEDSTQTKVEKIVEKSVETVQTALDDSTGYRKIRSYGFFGHYSPLDLIIPSKIGGSFYFSSDDKNTQYEIQYLQGSTGLSVLTYDFGKFTDQRFSFLVRSYSDTGSFNWYYGVSHVSLKAKLGSAYMATVTNNAESVDLLNIEAVALDIGIGNRWYFDSGLSIGVDWLGLSQPITSLKKSAPFTEASNNQNDIDDVRKFMDVATYFPRLYLIKFNLGYSF